MKYLVLQVEVSPNDDEAARVVVADQFSCFTRVILGALTLSPPSPQGKTLKLL